MTGTQDKIKGRAKVAAGAAIGDKSLENEGRIDRITGEAKDKLTDATNAVERLLNDYSGKAGEALQSGRRQLEELISKARS